MKRRQVLNRIYGFVTSGVSLGIVLALLALPVSCDSSDDPAPFVPPSEDVVEDPIWDIAPPPEDVRDEDMSKPGPSDVEPSPDIDPTPDPDAGPAPGLPGDPFTECTDHNQCISGWCVESREGRQCSKFCTGGDCPDGWSCQLVQSGGRDPYSICVPLHPRLCQPCRTNNDCATALTGDGALCIPHGPGGNFCGGYCNTDQECPGGFICDEVETLTGSRVLQCIPDDGAECDCTTKFVEAGFETDCYITNDHGTCTGVRYCTHQGLSECVDQNGAPILPPSREVCDGTDNNCDGIIDNVDQEACQVTNVWGTCYGTATCVDGQMRCDARTPEQERCDGIDNNCNGQTDEGFRLSAAGIPYCHDPDWDGDGILNEDDNCPWVYNPDQADLDRDGVGDACDPDIDGDGWLNEDDCKPYDPLIHPGAVELCDGQDNNCSGITDEGYEYIAYNGAVLQLGDPCGTGICEGGEVVCAADKLSAICSTGYLAEPKPICNGLDVTCNGITDEGFPDTDGDGVADCVDPDISGDGIPNEIDNCPYHYNPDQADLDGDGVGDACDPDIDGDGWPNELDCDPYDPLVYPGAPERCDGKDNNCNGITDEEGALGCVEYYRDQDGDGWGVTGDIRCLCEPTYPYTATKGGDCDDMNAAVNPGQVPVCGDGLDNNCSGTQNDENSVGCKFYFTDADGDGYGTHPGRCLCEPSGVFRSLNALDCDDGADYIHPGRTPDCNTPWDDNCSGSTNDHNSLGCKNFYYDFDGDGYGTDDFLCLCRPEGYYRADVAGDCDDNNRNIHPGMPSICNDGIDNNCSGHMNDEGGVGCQMYFYDFDGDGYGDVNRDPRCLCGPEGFWTATQGGDCNDQNPEINPGMPEICDGRDNNCSGLIDAQERPHSELCPPQDGALYRCIQGECVMDDCEPGWANMDGDSATGCECELDQYTAANQGNFCLSAVDLGTIDDAGNTPITRSGNIAPIGDADWFRFHAKDNPQEPCNRFKTVVKFTSNPNNEFVLDVFRGGCAGANEIFSSCEDIFSWSVNFHRAVTTPGAVGGECGCRFWDGVGNKPTTANHHLCSDNSATFYIRVRRRDGATPTCNNYTLEFSNGFYTGE